MIIFINKIQNCYIRFFINRRASFLRFIFILLLTITFFSCGKGNKEAPEIEIVESTPIETNLDNFDIANTENVWLDMINSADNTLDFEEYYISNKKDEPLDGILDAIIKAGNRGVQIRFIVDSKMYKTYPESVDMLSKQKNIQCRIIDFSNLTGGIQHAKYFIVDGEQIFIGSQNFDWRALKHIHELGVRIKHHELVKVYQEIFDHDWIFANKNQNFPQFDNVSTSVNSFTFYSPQYDSVTLIPTFSPKDYIPVSANWDETQILSLINYAKKSIYLQFLTYNPFGYDKIYYPLLDSALINAASRGVGVKLIVSDWNIGKNPIEYLKKLASYKNIEVKYSSIPDWSGGYIPFARVEHSKFIVADSNACWIGTSNAEKSYYYNTRNVGIIIKNQTLATRLHNIFIKSWYGDYVHPITPEGEYTSREHGEKK